MEYGYARVSTKEQNEQRQIIALEEFGLNLRQIFIDKQSGKNFERANYQRLTRRLKEGDTLVVKSIPSTACMISTIPEITTRMVLIRGTGAEII